MDFDFTARLWLWNSRPAVHFVTVPPDVSEVIRTVGTPPARGFGSVRVAVTIGASQWQTSIFPQSADETYVLPVKKQVRTAEGIAEGDEVNVRLEVVAG